MGKCLLFWIPVQLLMDILQLGVPVFRLLAQLLAKEEVVDEVLGHVAVLVSTQAGLLQHGEAHLPGGRAG